MFIVRDNQDRKN